MTRGQNNPKQEDEHQRGGVSAARTSSDVNAEKRDEQSKSGQGAPPDQA